MTAKDDIAWFKQNFQPDIEQAIQGTPLSVDLIVAVAMQETGHIWRPLRRKGLTVPQILSLCVGDTIDGASKRPRKAFPRNKDELIQMARGQAMFELARQAVVDGAAAGIRDMVISVPKPNAICHGYGLFQYDLQFFKTDPDYFLERKWATFPGTLGKCVEELKSKMAKIGLGNKAQLTDEEMAHIAIAYNTGGFKKERGLKQGFKVDGRFYGELVFDFLKLSKSVARPAVPATNGATPPATPAHTITPAPVVPLGPAPLAATGPFFEVDTRVSSLNLRSSPQIKAGNIIAQLPDGHVVQSVSGQPSGGFMEVVTDLQGAHLRGFAHTNFLKLAPEVVAVPGFEPAPGLEQVPAVLAPARPGRVTRRSEPATPFSLNEPGQPGRTGTTPSARADELAAIITWLAVDEGGHKRYKPGSGKTFCNIYAHDYCHLAGVYLPRVWWSQASVARWVQGQTVNAHLNSTIEEQRANDLFRWLRDFGPVFGWRRIDTPDTLQREANQGAVALIVARRKIEGRSGHIVAVVPETETHAAVRNSGGVVTAPLQSQAGSRNFAYGTGTRNWWMGDQFAESAFWAHD